MRPHRDGCAAVQAGRFSKAHRSSRHHWQGSRWTTLDHHHRRRRGPLSRSSPITNCCRLQRSARRRHRHLSRCCRCRTRCSASRATRQSSHRPRHRGQLKRANQRARCVAATARQLRLELSLLHRRIPRSVPRVTHRARRRNGFVASVGRHHASHRRPGHRRASGRRTSREPKKSDRASGRDRCCARHVVAVGQLSRLGTRAIHRGRRQRAAPRHSHARPTLAAKSRRRHLGQSVVSNASARWSPTASGARSH